MRYIVDLNRSHHHHHHPRIYSVSPIIHLKTSTYHTHTQHRSLSRFRMSYCRSHSLGFSTSLQSRRNMEFGGVAQGNQRHRVCTIFSVFSKHSPKTPISTHTAAFIVLRLMVMAVVARRVGNGNGNHGLNGG